MTNLRKQGTDGDGPLRIEASANSRNPLIDYEDAAATYDATRSHSRRLVKRFDRKVGLTASRTILDFGCGSGNYLAYIRNNHGCRCCGTDPSRNMRRLAREKNSDLDIRPGDHRHIPFDEAAFDFSFMTDVIHHVPDLQSMFRELFRVSRPGALLCVVTQSHEQIAARFYNRYFPSLAANETARYPDTRDIVDGAIACGWSPDEVQVQPQPRVVTIDRAFLATVEQKNYSMFLLLDDVEYGKGLAGLREDAGKTVEQPGAGETLIWFRKDGRGAGQP
jgi:SAM-dependent methyltransferase